MARTLDRSCPCRAPSRRCGRNPRPERDGQSAARPARARGSARIPNRSRRPAARLRRVKNGCVHGGLRARGFGLSARPLEVTGAVPRRLGASQRGQRGSLSRAAEGLSRSDAQRPLPGGRLWQAEDQQAPPKASTRHISWPRGRVGEPVEPRLSRPSTWGVEPSQSSRRRRRPSQPLGLRKRPPASTTCVPETIVLREPAHRG
jgi:hypothetical protein